MRLPTVVIRREMLTSWLNVSAYSQSRLASELGVSRGRISQLLTSREEPSAHLIAKLMTLTNLPFDRLFKVMRAASTASSSAQASSRLAFARPRRSSTLAMAARGERR